MKKNQKYEITILVELHDANYRIDSIVCTGDNITEAIEDAMCTYRIFEGTSTDEEGSIFAFESLHVRKMMGD